MGEVGYPQVGSVDGVCRAIRYPLCIEVGHLIVLHPEMGSPSDRDRVASAHRPLVEPDGRHREALPRS